MKPDFTDWTFTLETLTCSAPPVWPAAPVHRDSGSPSPPGRRLVPTEPHRGRKSPGWARGCPSRVGLGPWPKGRTDTPAEGGPPGRPLGLGCCWRRTWQRRTAVWKAPPVPTSGSPSRQWGFPCRLISWLEGVRGRDNQGSLSLSWTEGREKTDELRNWALFKSTDLHWQVSPLYETAPWPIGVICEASLSLMTKIWRSWQ